MSGVQISPPLPKKSHKHAVYPLLTTTFHLFATLCCYTQGMEELSYYPGLIQRGSVFHYRKRVHTDIVGSFGRREIWTSLGTGNRPEAVKRARRVAVELDNKFDVHRHGQAEPFQVKELSQKAINKLAEFFCQQVVNEHDKSRYDILR